MRRKTQIVFSPGDSVDQSLASSRYLGRGRRDGISAECAQTELRLIFFDGNLRVGCEADKGFGKGAAQFFIGSIGRFPDNDMWHLAPTAPHKAILSDKPACFHAIESLRQRVMDLWSHHSLILIYHAARD